MSAEEELLRRLRAALRRADLEVDDLIGEAWEEARTQVRDLLRRAMVQDLLTRALSAMEGGTGEPEAAPRPAGAATTDEPPEEPARADREPPRSPTVAGSATRTPFPREGADEPTARRSEAPPGHPGPETLSTAPADVAGTYVLGITRDTADLPNELPSLPGAGPVRAIDRDGLRILVSDVGQQTIDVLSDPGPEGLDLLAAAALAHDEILATVAREQPVVPLRLGTLVSDDDAAVELLRRHRDGLHRELTRFEGRAEWAVTVRPVPGRELPDAAPAEGSGEESGRSYLEQRREALDARQRRWEAREALCDEIHQRLRACAVEAQTIDRRPLEDAAPPLLHGVYLLDEARLPAFLEAVDAVRGERPEVLVEVSGPLPPYHFVALGDALDEAASS